MLDVGARPISSSEQIIGAALEDEELETLEDEKQIIGAALEDELEALEDELEALEDELEALEVEEVEELKPIIGAATICDL